MPHGIDDKAFLALAPFTIRCCLKNSFIRLALSSESTPPVTCMATNCSQSSHALSVEEMSEMAGHK